MPSPSCRFESGVILTCCVLFGSVGCAKLSSVAINLVPSYTGSAYRCDEIVEKALVGFEEALRTELYTTGRRQRRLALRPARRVIDAAIAIKTEGDLDCTRSRTLAIDLKEGLVAPFVVVAVYLQSI